MIAFTDRTPEQQDLIRNAFQFEYNATQNRIADPNPYVADLKAIPEGENLWKAITDAVEWAFC